MFCEFVWLFFFFSFLWQYHSFLWVLPIVAVPCAKTLSRDTDFIPLYLIVNIGTSRFYQQELLLKGRAMHVPDVPFHHRPKTFSASFTENVKKKNAWTTERTDHHLRGCRWNVGTHSVRALFTMSSWMCDGLKRWRACACRYTIVKVSTYLCVVGFVSKTTSSSSSLQSDRERPTADLLGLSGNPWDKWTELCVCEIKRVPL